MWLIEVCQVHQISERVSSLAEAVLVHSAVTSDAALSVLEQFDGEVLSLGCLVLHLVIK